MPYRPMVLADLEPGDVAAISRVPDRDPEQLRYLGELGVVPGQTITVLEKLPFDGPIRVLRRGGRASLRAPPGGAHQRRAACVDG